MIAIGRAPGRLERAKAVGADVTFSSLDGDPVAFGGEAIDPRAAEARQALQFLRGQIDQRQLGIGLADVDHGDVAGCRHGM